VKYIQVSIEQLLGSALSAIKSDEPLSLVEWSSKQFFQSNHHHSSMDSSFVLVEDDEHIRRAPPGKEQPTPAKKQVRRDIFGAPEPLLGSLQLHLFLTLGISSI
jgi:hypothetical protein